MLAIRGPRYSIVVAAGSTIQGIPHLRYLGAGFPIILFSKPTEGVTPPAHLDPFLLDPTLPKNGTAAMEDLVDLTDQ